MRKFSSLLRRLGSRVSASKNRIELTDHSELPGNNYAAHFLERTSFLLSEENVHARRLFLELFMSIAKQVCPERPHLADIGGGLGKQALYLANRWPEIVVDVYEQAALVQGLKVRCPELLEQMERRRVRFRSIDAVEGPYDAAMSNGSVSYFPKGFHQFSDPAQYGQLIAVSRVTTLTAGEGRHRVIYDKSGDHYEWAFDPSLVESEISEVGYEIIYQGLGETLPKSKAVSKGGPTLEARDYIIRRK